MVKWAFPAFMFGGTIVICYLESLLEKISPSGYMEYGIGSECKWCWTLFLFPVWPLLVPVIIALHIWQWNNKKAETKRKQKYSIWLNGLG